MNSAFLTIKFNEGNVKEIPELMCKNRSKTTKGWPARRMIICVVCFIALLGLFLIVPARAQAHDTEDESYILRTKKPEEDEGHYLEFVNPDKEKNYTVQAGDTLWGIAETYYGSGAAYHQLWEENKAQIDRPETLQVGTELKMQERLYIAAGVEDYHYHDEEEIHKTFFGELTAWEWDPDGYRYQVFQMLSDRNDFGENDPYSHWEEFKREVAVCGKEICGDRVSDLSFARYRVTDLCDLCCYQFIFESGGKRYLIIAAVGYTDEQKNEAFTVCDLDRCDENDLKEVQGKTAFLATCTETVWHIAKSGDYVGASDWNYPQLRNPFTQAMRSFCDEPLERTEPSANDREIAWKDKELELLVRDGLAGIWQLTEEEKKTFLAQPMTTADLSGIKSLSLYEDRWNETVYLQLNGYEIQRSLFYYSESAISRQMELTTLDDLANFSKLERLDIILEDSEITDFAALGELTGLRELYMEVQSAKTRLGNEDIAFLGKLANLRRLYLYGWRHTSLDKITDMSILRNCPHLTYLRLETGNVENYDFLGELPEIHYINLLVHYTREDALPDPGLLPNAAFITYNGESIRWDVGRTETTEDDR